MKPAISAVLLAALVLSWLWFWTYRAAPREHEGTTSIARVSDTITVWIDELIGSPDEAYYYELADLWNATHPDVKMNMCVMSYAGYESKLRVAISSGQPPDVCLGGRETLEYLKYTGKSPDLAVPIPEEVFPADRLRDMGKVVEKSIVRDGRPTVFPIYRYCYGGFLFVDRKMLAETGFDDEEIRRDGWTFDQFREACRRMTRDTNGDGKPDTWGFAAALVHLQHLFLNEFGPGVWGREVARGQFLAWDGTSGRWVLDPRFTEEQVFQVFLFFYQLLDEDKTWNPASLGMNWNEINDEIVVHHRLGMTFGETPWVAKLRRDIWEQDKAMGAKLEGPPPDFTVLWMPTLRPGERPAPRAGVVGISVLKQTPYKGDAHTENALRVALFLTHPTHLARSQLRKFRHLPPDPVRFAQIYPELIQNDDRWVKFYNEIMDSDIPIVAEPLSPDAPGTAHYLVVRAAMDRWFEKEGIDYLQQVLYDKLTPRESARRFYSALKSLVEESGSVDDGSP